MSYSDLHIEDSHINFFSENPFSTENHPSSTTKQSDKKQVQIIAIDELMGRKLIDQFRHCQINFGNLIVTSLGFIGAQGVSSLIPVLKKALSENVISIFVGYDKSILKAVFDGFQFAERHFNMAHIQDDIGRPNGIDTQILPLADPYMHQLNLIGSQSMLANTTFLEQFEDRGLSHHRLGQLRNNLAVVEPEIRSSNIFSVNLNAIKYPEADCQTRKSPIGFGADEVCQLSHYAGRAESNQVFCIYEIEQDGILRSQNMNLLTNLIWYFLQGVDFRGPSFPPDPSSMKTYLIEGKIENLALEFYKDEKQQKWWLKCPVEPKKFKTLYPLIACDYQDYWSAINDRTLSDRLRAIIARF